MMTPNEVLQHPDVLDDLKLLDGALLEVVATALRVQAAALVPPTPATAPALDLVALRKMLLEASSSLLAVVAVFQRAAEGLAEAAATTTEPAPPASAAPPASSPPPASFERVE
jgi:hypothetical protein